MSLSINREYGYKNVSLYGQFVRTSYDSSKHQNLLNIGLHLSKNDNSNKNSDNEHNDGQTQNQR